MSKELEKKLRRIVASFTILCFLFNIIGTDILVSTAWGAVTPERSVSESIQDIGIDNVSTQKSLNTRTFTLPQNLGKITDSWTPYLRETRDEGRETSDGFRGTVFFVQDAHCNYGAQKKIADIIEYMNIEYGINTVNLEGGAGKYDLSVFTGIKDKKIREKVSDYFVKEGMVNGAEYYAINNPGQVNLWGIEDTDLYLKNLNTYRESLGEKETIGKYTKELGSDLNKLKLRIYSEELLKFERKHIAYRTGNIEFKEYVKYLFEKREELKETTKNDSSTSLGMTSDGSPERGSEATEPEDLINFKKTLQLEEQINFKKADNQREDLIKKLERTLSINELKALAIKTIEFKEEKISQKIFHEFLIQQAKTINFKLDDYDEIRKYSEYITAYDAIDETVLMSEIDTLEEMIQESLIKNDRERELTVLSKNLVIMRKLFDFLLTSEEYAYYEEHKQDFDIENYISFVDKEFRNSDVIAPVRRSLGEGGRREWNERRGNLNAIDQYREDVSKFYKYSFKRDDAFLKNIRFSPVIARSDSDEAISKKLSTMDHGLSTVLISGGFHTENLTQLFKDKGISYVCITPKFDNVEGYKSPYFDLLSGGMNSFARSISTALSLIQIPSLLNELGLKANDPRKAELFRIQAIALQSMYNTETPFGFKLDNGKYVIFDKNSGKPSCYVSNEPGEAKILAENVIKGNANSIIAAFSEIGQDRIIREVQDRTYLKDESREILNGNTISEIEEDIMSFVLEHGMHTEIEELRKAREFSSTLSVDEIKDFLIERNIKIYNLDKVSLDVLGTMIYFMQKIPDQYLSGFKMAFMKLSGSVRGIYVPVVDILYLDPNIPVNTAIYAFIHELGHYVESRKLSTSSRKEFFSIGWKVLPIKFFPGFTSIIICSLLVFLSTVAMVYIGVPDLLAVLFGSIAVIYVSLSGYIEKYLLIPLSKYFGIGIGAQYIGIRKKDTKKFISEYSTISPEEFFAENFSVFLLHNRKFKEAVTKDESLRQAYEFLNEGLCPEERGRLIINKTRSLLDSIADRNVREILKSGLDYLLERKGYFDESGRMHSPEGYSAIQLIDGLPAAHTGGQGIYLPKRDENGNELTSKELSLRLIHELIAGVYAGVEAEGLDSHVLAQKVENAFRTGDKEEAGRLLAIAESYNKPVWEMTPEERLKVDRDFASFGGLRKNRKRKNSVEPLLHKGYHHHEFYWWLKKEIKEERIPKGLPLILFDTHSDSGYRMGMSTKRIWHRFFIKTFIWRGLTNKILATGNWVSIAKAAAMDFSETGTKFVPEKHAKIISEQLEECYEKFTGTILLSRALRRIMTRFEIRQRVKELNIDNKNNPKAELYPYADSDKDGDLTVDIRGSSHFPFTNVTAFCVFKNLLYVAYLSKDNGQLVFSSLKGNVKYRRDAEKILEEWELPYEVRQALINSAKPREPVIPAWMETSQMKPLGLREHTQLDLSAYPEFFINEAKSAETDPETGAKIIYVDFSEYFDDTAENKIKRHARGIKLKTGDGKYIIVINSYNDDIVQKEALFHEQREIFWIRQGLPEDKAHVIASAEQIKKFSNDYMTTTPYHELQLNSMTPGQLKAIQNETESERAWHHGVLEDAGVDDVQKIKDYEGLLRLSMKSEYARRGDITDGNERFKVNFGREIVVPGAKGARILSSLQSEEDIRKLTSSDPDAPPGKGYQIIAESGRTKLGNLMHWGDTATSLDLIDNKFKILAKIEELARERKDVNQPIIILDWGCGQGTALVELREILNKLSEQIPNVELVGYSDIFYRTWKDAPEGITFIYDVPRNLLKYFGKEEIQLIYSYLGLSYFTVFSGENPPINYFEQLGRLLQINNGELRTNNHNLTLAEIFQANFVEIRGDFYRRLIPVKDKDRRNLTRDELDRVEKWISVQKVNHEFHSDDLAKELGISREKMPGLEIALNTIRGVFIKHEIPGWWIIKSQDNAVSINSTSDITIASYWKIVDHIAYNKKVVGENKEVLGRIAKDIGADEMILDNEDYNFRGAIEMLLDADDNRVNEDSSGNIIVTLKENARYLILTKSTDPITGERELIFIDDRFGADHAGRTRNQVYARDLPLAMHELYELRSWKGLEKYLIDTGEINFEVKSNLPKSIKEWTKQNIEQALIFDSWFHINGEDAEVVVLNNVIKEVYEPLNADNRGKVDFSVLFSVVIENIGTRISKHDYEEFILKKELKNLPKKEVSFKQMLTIFDKGKPGDKVRLAGRPTARELELLRERGEMEVFYEINIFKRKSTGEWFAARGSVQTVGVHKFSWLLSLLGDIEYDYHNHPLPVADLAIPPSAEDLKSILQKSKGNQIAACGDVKYIYVYSVNGNFKKEKTEDALIKEMKEEYDAIFDTEMEKAEAAGINGYADLNKFSENFYSAWKAYVEALGFLIERYDKDEFLEGEDVMYERFRDMMPSAAKQAEDVIITNKQKHVREHSIRQAKRSIVDQQTQAAKAVIQDMRQDTTDIVVMPGSEIYAGPQAEIARKAEKTLRKEYGLFTVPLHYAYGDDWQQNLRPVMEKALRELQTKMDEGDEAARVIVSVPKGGKDFVEGILEKDKFKNYKLRFSIIKLEDIPSNGMLDEVMHIVLAKGLLNYERYKKGDYGEAELSPDAKTNLVNFIKTLVSNPKAVDFNGDPAKVLNSILEGILSLKIQPYDFKDIMAYKRQQDEVLQSL